MSSSNSIQDQNQTIVTLKSPQIHSPLIPITKHKTTTISNNDASEHYVLSELNKYTKLDPQYLDL